MRVTTPQARSNRRTYRTPRLKNLLQKKREQRIPITITEKHGEQRGKKVSTALVARRSIELITIMIFTAGACHGGVAVA